MLEPGIVIVMFTVDVSRFAFCANLKEHRKLGKFSGVFSTQHDSPENLFHDFFGEFAL